MPALTPSCKKRFMGFFARLLLFLRVKHQRLKDMINFDFENLNFQWKYLQDLVLCRTEVPCLKKVLQNATTKSFN